MLLLLYFCLAVPLLFYLYVKWAHSYWQRKGVEYIDPEFLFGNIDELFGTVHRSQVFKNIYKYFKIKGLKYGGVYRKLTPVFIPIDLDLVKSILHTDFSHFVNHDGYVNEETDPLSGNIFNLRDEKWRNVRAKLTPTFTSGKMKMMFRTIVECTNGLEKILNTHALSKEPLNAKDCLVRFTIDIISSVAFGVEAKSLEDPESPFRKIGHRIVDHKHSTLSRIKIFLNELIPEWVLQLMKVNLQRPEIEKFFYEWVKKIVEYREQNDIYRRDFMHLLIQLKNRNEVSDDGKLTKDSKKNFFLSIEQMSAHSFIFFVAGFETSSSAISSTLFHLASNQDIQDKTREEVNRILEKHNNNLSYEAIMEMEYLDRVLSETLRLSGVASSIRRVCNKDFKVPNSDLIIEKGTLVRIPVHGLHNDPEYYPNPEKFDPDRFSPENKQKIPAYAYLPFGEGPRLCIGLRFAKLHSKVGLSFILKNFKITLNGKTKLPIQIEPQGLTPNVVGGIWINVERI